VLDEAAGGGEEGPDELDERGGEVAEGGDDGRHGGFALTWEGNIVVWIEGVWGWMCLVEDGCAVL
jgi:hypothetical protein